MVTIDLTTPPPPPTSFLDGMARRLALTLPELRLVAELAGDAPLPFDLPSGADEAVDAGSLSGRLGKSRGSVEDSAYADALAHAPRPGGHPAPTRPGHRRRAPTPGSSGPSGLLATPRLALDIDVAAGATQVKAWHRQAGGAVASLSTCDGIVFELAWFPVDQWTTELARVTAASPRTSRSAPIARARPPRRPLRPRRRGRRGAALRPLRPRAGAGRPVRRRGGARRRSRSSATPRPPTPCRAVHTEGRGRMRILAAEVSDGPRRRSASCRGCCSPTAGTPSTPRHDDDGARVAVARVDPDDLATELAPVLAQVTAPERRPQHERPDIPRTHDGRRQDSVGVGRRRQVRPDAGAGRPLRRLRQRDAHPRPPRHRDPRRRRRRRLRRAVHRRPGRGRGGHPRRHDRQAAGC